MRPAALALVLAASAALAGAARAEVPTEVRLAASDGVDLRADSWTAAPPRPRIVVVLPGYAQNRSTRTLRAIAALITPSADALVVDLRGTGGSGGEFTFGAEEPRDAQAALRWALDRYPDVSLLGFSLGSYTALRAGVEGPLRPRRVLMVSLPTRLEGIITSGGLVSFWAVGAWEQFADRPVLGGDSAPFFRWGPLFLPKPFAPDLAARAELPLHFLSGGRDLLVLPSQSRLSFDAAQGPATWTLWPSGRHAEHMAIRYPDAFVTWLRGCLDWSGSGKASDPFGVSP